MLVFVLECTELNEIDEDLVVVTSGEYDSVGVGSDMELVSVSVSGDGVTTNVRLLELDASTEKESRLLVESSECERDRVKETRWIDSDTWGMDLVKVSDTSWEGDTDVERVMVSESVMDDGSSVRTSVLVYVSVADGIMESVSMVVLHV